MHSFVSRNKKQVKNETQNIMKTKYAFIALLAVTSLTKGTFAQETSKLPLICSVSLTTPKCHGSSDGEIDLTISGGHAPYTVIWGNGTSGTTLTGIGAGNYDVMVIDSHQDTISGPITVIEPAEIVINGIITSVSNLGSANGAIDVTVSGLLETYTYSWGTVYGSGIDLTTLDQDGLKIGTYNLKVTSAGGCTVEKSFRVGLSFVHKFQNIQEGGSLTPDKLIVYPNPSNGTVNFRNVEMDDKIEIYNTYGLLVKTLNAQEPTDLPTGNYQVNIKRADGTVQNETLIVR